MTALFSSPEKPPPPPPPPALPPPAPTPVDQAVLDAGKQARVRANQAGGLAGTNATGPKGLVEPADTTRGQLKTMLG